LPRLGIRAFPSPISIRDRLIFDHTPLSASPLSLEQRVEALDELFDSIKVPAGVQEGAFHRENWYR
jgi:hypothetical protein